MDEDQEEEEEVAEKQTAMLDLTMDNSDEDDDRPQDPLSPQRKEPARVHAYLSEAPEGRLGRGRFWAPQAETRGGGS